MRDCSVFTGLIFHVFRAGGSILLLLPAALLRTGRGMGTPAEAPAEVPVETAVTETVVTAAAAAAADSCFRGPEE